MARLNIRVPPFFDCPQVRIRVLFNHSGSQSLCEPPRRRAASLVGTLRPGRVTDNRAVAVTLVAVLLRWKFRFSLLLAHRRQREVDPPPGLTFLTSAAL